jgi:serine/threonine protein kinase
MKLEHWRRVEELLNAALETPPEARRAFLDAACGEDPGLRQQVAILVSKGERDGSLWDELLAAGASTTLRVGGSLVGRELGTYRILSPLGAGAMGEVYRAHDARLDRDVAIRTLSTPFARDPDRLMRFKCEARKVSLLDHPNIAAIYGMDESGGVDFLVLELAEGDMLSGPLPLATALQRASQVALALESAHEEGIFHLDLKPANVKVVPQGRVKVLDFGLAKAVRLVDGHHDVPRVLTATEVETSAGNFIGTLGYMSPEQIRGKPVDRRTDIWAFGCLLYELLTGHRAFAGDMASETIAAVLEGEPDWHALPVKTPAKIRDLLRQCLRKDADRRLDNIANARRTIEQAQRGWNGPRVIVAAAALAGFAFGAGLCLRAPASPLDRSRKLTDSVSHVAAFIRGNSTVYDALSDGEPVHLTHDNGEKWITERSPDASSVALTIQQAQDDSRDARLFPAPNGEPQLPSRQIPRSETNAVFHRGIVAARDYFSDNGIDMARGSYLPTNGKWVLFMRLDHRRRPCGVPSIDGSLQGRQLDPQDGRHTPGVWWPTAAETRHAPEQRLPDDRPEQITAVPMEAEAISIVPEGRPSVTSMTLQNSSLWVHDGKRERELVTGGYTAGPKFTSDGKKLCYRMIKETTKAWLHYRNAGEVRVMDLESGHSELLARGLQAFDYDISADGRQVVMEAADIAGKAQLWLAPLDRSSPPRQIPNVEGGSPRFGPRNEIYFLHRSGTWSTGVVYRVYQDGTALENALEHPILDLRGVSPDGHWVLARSALGRDAAPAWQAIPLGGGPGVTIGSATLFDWAPGGNSLSVTSESGGPIPEGRSYLIPLPHGVALPRIPAGTGFHTEEEIARLTGASRIDAYGVIPGPFPNVYAFYRGVVLRPK